MYLPLVKAFNYALHRLSSFKVPGLPEFREESHIAFARSATKCIKPGSYLQGSYKPDIVLVKWDTLKKAHKCAGVTYSHSWASDVYCGSGCDQPTFSWGNLLSTLEVKRGGPGGGAGNIGNKPFKGKGKGKHFQSTYTRDFSDFGGGLEVAAQPGPPRPAELKMVGDESPTRSRKFTTPSSSPLLTFS